AWERIKDNSVVKFFESVLEVILKIIKGLAIIDQATAIKLSQPPAAAPSGDHGTGGSGSEAPVAGHAEGGPIRGPGTATSDSIPARLSNGEFVVRASAVQSYGEGLFHALNNMSF